MSRYKRVALLMGMNKLPFFESSPHTRPLFSDEKIEGWSLSVAFMATLQLLLVTKGQQTVIANNPHISVASKSESLFLIGDRVEFAGDSAPCSPYMDNRLRNVTDCWAQGVKGDFPVAQW